MDFQSLLRREINLPNQHSFFLFGARQTGKTSLIQESFNKSATRSYNLFLTDHYSRFAADPGRLREEIASLPSSINYVFIDEVQRVPELLNEVQYLLDQKIPQHFILTGSSARKLKRGKANLLAGRAWAFDLFPLTQAELPQGYPLSRTLAFGTLPPNVVARDDVERRENLKAYVEVYLKEEIEMEALSRNIGGFIRFLAIASQSNGEQLNFSNISRDVGVSDVTVKEYFKILEDTLLGFFHMPFSFSERKRHKLSPKFYFFDTGVLRSAQKKLRLELQPHSFEFGNYFETWVINEVKRISSYLRKDLELSFLRTSSGVEVDLIITFPDGCTWAVEIKSKKTPIEADFAAGFKAALAVCPKARCLCVCPGEYPRKIGPFEILPYQQFFDELRQAG